MRGSLNLAQIQRSLGYRLILLLKVRVSRCNGQNLTLFGTVITLSTGSITAKMVLGGLVPKYNI